MNAEVLWAAAEVWVAVFDFEGSGGVPRTFPVRMVLDQASVGMEWETPPFFCFIGFKVRSKV